MKCDYHLCKNESDKRFCSYNCKNKYHVDLRRKKVKVMSVEYKGGKCEKCGYNKSYAALEFHHRDPKEKLFGLGNPQTRKWETIKAELDKCDMLCANCHRELENKPYEFKYQLLRDRICLNNGRVKDVKLPIEPKQKRYCLGCGKSVKKGIKRCKGCYLLTVHHDKPSKEWLSQLVYMMPMSKIGETYGVTDNSVRKWCKNYGIEIPKLGAGYWLKKNK